MNVFGCWWQLAFWHKIVVGMVAPSTFKWPIPVGITHCWLRIGNLQNGNQPTQSPPPMAFGFPVAVSTGRSRRGSNPTKIRCHLPSFLVGLAVSPFGVFLLFARRLGLRPNANLFYPNEEAIGDWPNGNEWMNGNGGGGTIWIWENGGNHVQNWQLHILRGSPFLSLRYKWKGGKSTFLV